MELLFSTPSSPFAAESKSTTVEYPVEASDLLSGRHRQNTLMLPDNYITSKNKYAMA